MNKRISEIIIMVIISMMFLYACKKTDAPENPFDSIDRSGNNITGTEPDPDSITGLHKNIFFPKCANPGCHDGTFEPDYRTVESTYSTLVYQPVNKTTLDSARFFSHRVLPGNVNDSWLIERLTTPTSEYMPSNGVRLPDADIQHIKNWITSGCPDDNGQLPVKPNLLPNIIGYVALDSANVRIDTIRVDNFVLNPFIVRAGSTMNIVFVATDSSDGSEGTDPANFTTKQIRFSTDKNNFNSAAVINASLYISQYTAWLVTVPVTWAPGTTVYFRIYVNDGDHPGSDSVFPRQDSFDYFKTLYAFYVQ